jgi:hypothetical protein
MKPSRGFDSGSNPDGSTNSLFISISSAASLDEELSISSLPHRMIPTMTEFV